MRSAENINFAFFLFLILLAWRRALVPKRRAKVMVLGTASISLVFCVQVLDRFWAPFPASVIRDWLPVFLILLAYRTAGLFFAAPNEELQNRLIRFDRKCLGWFRASPAGEGIPRSIAAFLELSYLLCYPLLPLGLGALYVARLESHADAYWTVVLISAYLCYAPLPFAQTLPPRMLATESKPLLPPTKMRELNLWILRYGSIRANTFPSAHVATAFSVSLAVVPLLPGAGIAFLFISFGIAIAAVLGRYHYAADALIGAALAFAVFLMALIVH